MKSEIQEIISTPLPWLKAVDPGAVVIATRIRLARNLSGFVFPRKAAEITLENVEELLSNRLRALRSVSFPYYFRFKGAGMNEVRVISERKLVPKPFQFQTGLRAVAVSEDCSVTAVVNSEDHLRIYYTLPGQVLTQGWESIDEIDNELAGLVDFAYDEQYGFLTSSLENFGTGLQVSALLHVPGICLAGQFSKFSRTLKELDMALTPLFTFSEEGPTGHLYSVSNMKSFGPAEAEVVSQVERCFPYLLQYEMNARKALTSRSRVVIFDDMIGRALGTLKHAQLVPANEAMHDLSVLRLGAELGRAPKEYSSALFDLLFRLLPGHMEIEEGRELTSSESEAMRAKIVREHLSKIE